MEKIHNVFGSEVLPEFTSVAYLKQCKPLPLLVIYTHLVHLYWD